MKCRASSAGATWPARATRSSRAAPIAWCKATRRGASQAVKDGLAEQVVGEDQAVAGGREHTGRNRVAAGDLDGKGRDAQRAGDDVCEQFHADDRGHLQHRLGGAGQPPDAPFDQVTDGGGDAIEGHAGVVGEEGHLAHEERVTTGAPVDPVSDGAVDRSPQHPLDELVHRTASMP
jgi:hypothetical protein